VHDVFIVEAAHDVDDGVGFADVGQELVAEAFALAGASDEAGDVENSTMAGWIFCGLTMADRASRRASGTSTMPTLGSMVQKG